MCRIQEARCIFVDPTSSNCPEDFANFIGENIRFIIGDIAWYCTTGLGGRIVHFTFVLERLLAERQCLETETKEDSREDLRIKLVDSTGQRVFTMCFAIVGLEETLLEI